MIFPEKKKSKGHIGYAPERKMVNGVVRRTWKEYPETAGKIQECMRRSKYLPRSSLYLTN